MRDFLVVEDEPLIRDHILSELRKLRPEAELLACKTVDEVKDLVRGGDFGVALLDIKLGNGGSGIDAAKVLREKGKTPIVFLSSFSDHDTVARTKEIRPESYLTKPFTPAQLRVTLECLLRGDQKRSSFSAKSDDILNSIQGEFEELVRRSRPIKDKAKSNIAQDAFVSFDRSLKSFELLKKVCQVDTYEDTLSQLWICTLKLKKDPVLKIQEDVLEFIECANLTLAHLKTFAEHAFR